MKARKAPQRGGQIRYCTHPVTAAIPLTLAGLYAVHVVETGGTTQLYYCEPESGRCSCGTTSGFCTHIAIAQANAVWAARTLSLVKEAT